VKIALACDRALLELIDQTASALASGDPAATEAIVRAAVASKIRVVRDDERESGARTLLNLGHTVGHALEAHGGYAKYRHGEAVAIGMAHELHATASMGFTPRALVTRTCELLGRLGLPSSAPAAEIAAAWSFVASDKKRVGDSVRLPVVTDAGAARIERVSLATLRSHVVRQA
jgi:shikimate kinase / 3-dehydroquinate synthase